MLQHTDHDRRTHARFSPSKAERFFACPGSPNLLARVPARPPSEYSIEGTNGHTVLEACLNNDFCRAGQGHKLCPKLKDEKLDFVHNYFYWSINVTVDYVKEIIDEYPDAEMYVERRVDPVIEAAPGEAAGHCDIIIWIPSIRTLYVIDYKHGEGIAKAAKGNRQVLQYAGGVLFEERPVVDARDVTSVVCVIVQPRAFHPDGIIREAEYTPFEVWEYMQELESAIERCLDPEAPLIPGEEQCRFCDAKTLCPARETQALQVASQTFSQIRDVGRPHLPAIPDLDVQRLAFIRQHAPMLRKFLDDVDNHCYELIRSGYHIPGAKLVHSVERRVWYEEEEEALRKAAALIGCPVFDLYYEKALPMTYVEKLVVEAFKSKARRGQKKIAAEDAKRAFAYLTIKQPSQSLSVVDEDDPRPAVSLGTAPYEQVAGLLTAPPKPGETK